MGKRKLSEVPEEAEYVSEKRPAVSHESDIEPPGSQELVGTMISCMQSV